MSADAGNRPLKHVPGILGDRHKADLVWFRIEYVRADLHSFHSTSWLGAFAAVTTRRSLFSYIKTPAWDLSALMGRF